MDHHHHEDKNTLTDPVCGMAVKETSQFYEKVDSKTFYFSFSLAFNILNIFSIYDKSIPLGSINVLESLSYTIAL